MAICKGCNQVHLDYHIHVAYKHRWSTHPKATLIYPKPSIVYTHSLEFWSILNSPFGIHISCQPSSYSFLNYIRCWHVIETSSVLFIELDYMYLWNRNTAVLLYNLLSGHGERKWLANMINPNILPFDAIFSNNWCSVTYCLVFSTALDCFRTGLNWFSNDLLFWNYTLHLNINSCTNWN